MWPQSKLISRIERGKCTFLALASWPWWLEAKRIKVKATAKKAKQKTALKASEFKLNSAIKRIISLTKFNEGGPPIFLIHNKNQNKVKIGV